MNYEQLSASVATYVSDFFINHPDDRFVYHNLDHTKAVVAAAVQIGNHYQLDDKDFFIVTTAAWFHDIGYLIDPTAHEARGAETAVKVLADLQVPDDLTLAIKGCILATRIPQDPHNRLEEIVCDADLFHLGVGGFKEKNRLMRTEKSRLENREYSKEAWRASTITFLESHHYHTDYARMLLAGEKAEHLKSLKKKEQSALESAPAMKQGWDNKLATPDIFGTQPIDGRAAEAGTLQKGGKEKSEKKAKKDTRPDKGIETMFRVTAGNNQKLSNMADNKAHIMISVNSIILSAVISLLLRKLDNYASLAIPTYFLITVSMLTIIFSILATRPTIPKGTFTPKDIEEKKTNLLFFGNFYKMQLEEYTAGMLQVMEDRDFLYGSLIKDVYAQGVVLGKKYRLLRTSYNIFMYGLILSVIAFIVASVIDIH